MTCFTKTTKTGPPFAFRWGINYAYMKTLKMLSVLALVFCGTFSYGQAVEAEVPGDNFSLEGALELFKQSDSPEEFERLLNSPDSKVNNLDLNGDGYIDYIRVHDRYQGNVHAFIIQAVISESEVQDIAVITLEKLANGKAVLQIIGDEDIYGIETIIEPTQEVRTYAGTRTTRTVVNVWAWPSVQYVYGPYYTGWVSPWGWYDRPIWWRAWRPVAYVHYHPIWRPYYSYYAPCYTRRVVYAHEIYHPYRSTSVIVHHRHRDQVHRYRTHYHDRDRFEGRRSSFVDNDRSSRNGAHPERGSDSYRNRERGSGEVEGPSNGRSSSGSRTAITDSQRTYERNTDRDINRNDSRRPVMTPETRGETRRQVQSNRDFQTERTSRTQGNPAGRERSTVNERSMRTEVERNPTEIRRSNVPATRSSETIRNSRPVEHQPATRSSSYDRRSSSPSPEIQRSSPAPRVERSSPPPRVERSSPPPRVERSSPAPSVQRSSPGPSRSESSPHRSGSRGDNPRSSENNRGRH